MKSKSNRTITTLGTACGVATLTALAGCGGNGGSGIQPNLGGTTAPNASPTSNPPSNTVGNPNSPVAPTAPTTSAITYKWAKTLLSATGISRLIGYSHGGTYIGESSAKAYYYGSALTDVNSQLNLITIPRGAVGNPSQVNDYGKMIGNLYFNNVIEPYYWTSPTTPVRLPLNPGTTLYNMVLSNTGAVAGDATVYNSPYLVVIPTPTTRPILLAKLGGSGVGYSTLAVSDNGTLLQGGLGKALMLYKAPYNTPGIPIKGVDGQTPNSYGLGKDGVVFGIDNTASREFYLLGPDYNKPIFMASNYFVYDINSKSELCGYFNNGGGNDNQTAVWPGVNSKPIDFYNMGDPGFQPVYASYIFNNGDVVVYDDYGNATYAVPSSPL